MSRALLPLVFAALALSAVGWLVWERTPPKLTPPNGSGNSAESQPTSQPASSLTSTQAHAGDDGLPEEATKKYPPGTFVALRLPKNLKKGLRLPDGSYLPLLNGVPFAAPVKRYEWDGPVTPVVGKITDNEGCEWWVHADGSTTTTRYLESRGPDGKPFQNTATIHGAKMPDSYGIPKEGGVPGTSGPGPKK